MSKPLEQGDEIRCLHCGRWHTRPPAGMAASIVRVSAVASNDNTAA